MSMDRWVVLPFAAGLLALMGQEIAASEPVPITVGETRQGKVVMEDLQRGGQTFELKASVTGDLTVNVTSFDFAPVVEIRTSAAGNPALAVPLRPLTSIGPNARVWFSANRDASYHIEVRPSSVAFCGASFQIAVLEGKDDAIAPAASAEADRHYWEEVDARAKASGRAACRVRSLLGRARPPTPPNTSRTLLSEALETAQTQLGPDHLLVASALEALANALPAGERIEKGLPMVERALAIRERTFGPDDQAIAVALVFATRFCERSGRADLGIPFAERRVEVLRRTVGPEHPDTLAALDDLGSTQAVATQFREGEATFRHVMATRERLFGESHPSLEGSFFNLAVLYRREGNLEAARPFYEKLISLLQSAPLPNASKIAMFQHDLATLLWELGDLEVARATLLQLRAEDSAATGQPSYLYADDLVGLEWDAGNTAEALRLQEELMTLLRESGRLDENLGAVVNYLSMLVSSGDFDRARTFYDEIRSVVEENAGAAQQLVASMVLSVANIRMIEGDFVGAMELARQSVTIFESSLGPESPNTMDAVTFLGDLQRDSGDLDAARAAYQRALATSEKLLGVDHPSTARARERLGELDMRTGDFASAASEVERALGIAESALGSQHPQVAATLVTLAAIKRHMGDLVAARALGERAETISRTHLILTTRSLSEREALSYASMRASALPMLLDLAAVGEDGDSVRRAWEALARSRALVLDEMAARHRHRPAEDPETARLEIELNAANLRYASLLVRGPGQDSVDRYRKVLEEAQHSKDAAEAALARRSAGWRSQKEGPPFDLASARRALPSGSALVAFASYARERDSKGNAPVTYVAFVLAPGSAEPIALPLPKTAVIDDLVARWNREAGRPGSLQAYRSAGESLRRAIWDPLVPRLGKTTTVFIVPDGVLALVNFASLPIGRSGYLLDHGPRLHYLSAERDLTRPTESTPKVNGGLLALGGPDFDARAVFAALRDTPSPADTVPLAPVAYRGPRSACTQFNAIRFSPLPGTEAEVREVSSMWKEAMESADPETSTSTSPRLGAIPMVGAAATEAAVKREAGGHRVLHIATHGFFAGAECPSPTGITRGVTGLVGQDTSVPVVPGQENPLLLSGLAFAGANHRDAASPDEDDGILTAEEIGALDLSGVEWAVLSACDTGRGEVKTGEGVFGLRRAFQVAGAQTLIMSLWSVEDESARAWMHALYAARLKEHLDTASSVRAASLAVLKARRAKKQSTHPFYWAGFVAAGDWR